MSQKKRKHTIMSRSDLPYVERIRLQQRESILRNRENAAKHALYCNSIAMHELEGIGYRRLIRFSFRYSALEAEFYEDGVEVGLVRAKQRLASMGIEIPGELFLSPPGDFTPRQTEVRDHAMQAAQISLCVAAIAMNDVFGFGRDRQARIAERVGELAKHDRAYLLKEMEKIGFTIINGKAVFPAEDAE